MTGWIPGLPRQAKPGNFWWFERRSAWMHCAQVTRIIRSNRLVMTVCCLLNRHTGQQDWYGHDYPLRVRAKLERGIGYE